MPQSCCLSLVIYAMQQMQIFKKSIGVKLAKIRCLADAADTENSLVFTSGLHTHIFKMRTWPVDYDSLPFLTSSVLQDIVVGSKAQGTVHGFADYGCFIRFYGDVKGMIHVSELGLPPGRKASDVYATGQVRSLDIIFALQPVIVETLIARSICFISESL